MVASSRLTSDLVIIISEAANSFPVKTYQILSNLQLHHFNDMTVSKTAKLTWL